MIDITEMGQALQQLFGETADRIARKAKFVQRESKMTGSKFVQTWVLGFLQHPKASLNLLCQVAADVGVNITKQGMQERLNPSAVQFLKEMFEHSKTALQSKIPIPLVLLAQFAAIQLVDSSNIALPDSLAHEFPGSGGSGPKAVLKLQTIWEFLRGNLSDVVQQTGLQPDQSFDGHLAHIAAGTLFLCDLGYFVLTALHDIAAGRAYFISRLDIRSVLYQRPGNVLICCTTCVIRQMIK